MAEMSELLFECYHIPRVCYGVDALFSFFHNHPDAGELGADCCYSVREHVDFFVLFFCTDKS